MQRNDRAAGNSRDTAGLRPVSVVSAALVAVVLAGCAESLPSLPKLADLNPFATKEAPLPGKRIPVVTESRLTGATDLAAADRPIALPGFVGNENWAQPGGNAANAPGHLALNGSVKVAWTANAGTGSSKYGKITASPIVYAGKVYTLDAAGKVTAFSVSGGGASWSASVAPEGTKNLQAGYGGGIAADGGRLYVGTGYGTVVALDPASGKRIWEKAVGAPVRSSPTAANDRVAVVTLDGELVLLAGTDGNELWRYKGITSGASLITNSSPAFDSDIVVAPFASGDIIALKVATGQPAWTENLARSRLASSFQSMSDAARPVIDGGTVYAVGHAGRMVATVGRTGERLWSNSIPSLQQPMVSGETLFVVDTHSQVMAVSRRDGKTLWTAKLPGEGTWSGPVLAGNKLWVVSSKGQLTGVDATTGKVEGSQSIGGAVYIAPIVAGARMFVLTDDAKLVALN